MRSSRGERVAEVVVQVIERRSSASGLALRVGAGVGERGGYGEVALSGSVRLLVDVDLFGDMDRDRTAPDRVVVD